MLSPRLLSQPVREVLEDPQTEIWLSPISVWEFLILAEKGRLDLDAEPTSWLSEALAKVPLKEAPLNFAIAEQSRRLSLAVEDPADRFIAATAQVMELTLVTADRRLADSSELQVLPNAGPG